MLSIMGAGYCQNWDFFFKFQIFDRNSWCFLKVMNRSATNFITVEDILQNSLVTKIFFFELQWGNKTI